MQWIAKGEGNPVGGALPIRGALHIVTTGIVRKVQITLASRHTQKEPYRQSRPNNGAKLVYTGVPNGVNLANFVSIYTAQ